MNGGAAVRVGVCPPSGLPGETLRPATLDRIAGLGFDHVMVGDHVSFWIGVGFDGLIFERWPPYGTPADVAEALAAYVDAGCGAINPIPCAASADEALEGAAEVRGLLLEHAA